MRFAMELCHPIWNFTTMVCDLGFMPQLDIQLSHPMVPHEQEKIFQIPLSPHGNLQTPHPNLQPNPLPRDQIGLVGQFEIQYSVFCIPYSEYRIKRMSHASEACKIKRRTLI